MIPLSPFAAEFLGTMLLMLLGNGVVANVLLTGTKGNSSGWLVITTAWGLAVFVGVLVAGPYSGAHLNPAVTLGLALIGKFPWSSVLIYVGAQFAGAFVGSFLVWIIYYDHFTQTTDPALVGAVFFTSPAIKHLKLNFFAELMGSFVLLYCVFRITGAEVSSSHSLIGLGSVGALPVALVVWVIGLGLGGTTGYAINPVRDLAPRLLHTLFPIQHKGGSEWQYAWIPILGPLAGAGLAALTYYWIH